MPTDMGRSKLGYTHIMTVGNDGTNYGFSTGAGYGAMKKKSGMGLEIGSLFATVASGNLFAHLGVATGKLPADKIVISFEGFDVNKGTGTVTFGEPITLVWSPVQSAYVANAADQEGGSGVNPALSAWIVARDGLDIEISITKYTGFGGTPAEVN